ncbi:hypothetical protein DB30_07449 [Enhygromyxa salina]|uniref:Uncharacterized protein n=1 Tax=Enhygromyxa salina TaxID=215803 RepID=A0A0C2CRS7_9BACT|nr:SIR2 family protein [Enhygromyxa salina]KIG13896.1 hypothetical protein DB30_07449 [Enhygromyxa salina]
MTRPTSFDLSKLENLAERIYHGQVVFFVGAGFSLDSEGLSGQRLLLRLLARFDAISSSMIERREQLAPAVVAKAKRLREVLRETFWLGQEGRDPLTTVAHAKILEQDYYRPNEWMCEAFGTLVDACSDVGLGQEFWVAVHERETELLECNPIWGRVERVSPIEPGLLVGAAWGPSERGKALFLDTLGFADPQVMAGRPHAREIEAVEQSYADRLRPRHHIIARWAREGLCRTLLTTNYDMLLEGAYRLSGFACRLCDVPGEDPEPPPLLTELSHFARIGQAADFFRFGHTHRSALVAKIHGCAECYRWARTRVVEAIEAGDDVELAAARQAFASYLPSIVFTFREIQNWREDAWSRDLLANLLRTRSIVFCGYSIRDRVLHDAFRTAFEEIATVNARVGGFGSTEQDEQQLHAVHGLPQRSRRTATSQGPERGRGPDDTAAGAGAAAEAALAQIEAETTDSRAQRARAFFLGGPGGFEFDALEVLRAASRAEGIGHPSQTHHPNYLQSYFEGMSGFPRLDQTMRWLWHRTVRIRQEQCVEVDLRRVATNLLGQGCPERERSRVLDRLHELTNEEFERARTWEREGPSDSQFDRVVGWTDRFHPALLRELAIGEAVLRRDGPGNSVRVVNRRQWFFPPSEHPQWTGWGVVVEIALRRMIASWRGELGDWAKSSPCVTPGQSKRPAVSFSSGTEALPSTPRALAIVLTGFDRRSTRPRVRGAFAGRVHHWRLRAQTIPWWASDQRPLAGTPGAVLLWRWAVADEPSPAMLDQLPGLLGIDSPVESGQSRPLRVA